MKTPVFIFERTPSIQSIMRLLYVANLRLPTDKAYGIQIAKMCEAFAAVATTNNSIVKLVAPYRKNEIKEPLFDYYGVKRNFKFRKIWAPDFYLPGRLDNVAVNLKNFISAVLLCFYILTRKADIIYTRDEWPAYFLSFFKNNVVFEAHKFYANKKFFYRRFKNRGIKMIVISNGLKNDFMFFGFSADKLLVASDGVDLRLFDLNISKNEAREKINLPLDKKIAMYSGHLFDWKGAALLLEVARNLKFKNLNFKTEENPLFIFVGGTDYDVEKFREKAKGLDNVLILGHKPYSQIPLYLKAADILVLPNSAKEEISRRYTSPLKLFEYMASSRPIVASNLASTREILNEKNSVLVKPDDPGSLAGGIIKILRDNSLGERVAENARKEAENYTWTKRTASILAFIA